MNVFDILNNNGMVEIPNPQYNPKSKKNNQPATLRVPDDGTRNPVINTMRDYYDKDYHSSDILDIKPYVQKGLTWWKDPTDLTIQMANLQSASSKWWNSIKQSVVSEVGLGTAIGFANLYDIISLEVFKSNNDYQNPVSAFLTKVQEDYRNNNKIWVDPRKNISNGGLADAGWWASNLPSVMSSLTLLIPARGMTGALSLIGKGLKANKLVGYTRKALTGARNVKTIEDANRLSTISKWANKQSTITAANRMFENGVTAAGMRTLENYQESSQVYNDMYEQASNSLLRMSNEEYNTWLNKHADEISTYNITNKNDRDEVAKAIAHKSATTTFFNRLRKYFIRCSASICS